MKNMYAIISTVHIKAHCVATFRQRWRAVIEPAINQFPELVDLYVLINPATETLLYSRKSYTLTATPLPVTPEALAQLTFPLRKSRARTAQAKLSFWTPPLMQRLLRQQMKMVHSRGTHSSCPW
jgi:hypothetical protein